MISYNFKLESGMATLMAAYDPLLPFNQDEDKFNYAPTFPLRKLEEPLGNPFQLPTTCRSFLGYSNGIPQGVKEPLNLLKD